MKYLLFLVAMLVSACAAPGVEAPSGAYAEVCTGGKIINSLGNTVAYTFKDQKLAIVRIDGGRFLVQIPSPIDLAVFVDSKTGKILPPSYIGGGNMAALPTILPSEVRIANGACAQ